MFLEFYQTEIRLDADVRASSAQTLYLSTTNLNCVRHYCMK